MSGQIVGGFIGLVDARHFHAFLEITGLNNRIIQVARDLTRSLV